MSDMRTSCLSRMPPPAHSLRKLSARDCALSPSSCSADAQLSLLEGDCVGQFGHNFKSRASCPTFLFCDCHAVLELHAASDGFGAARLTERAQRICGTDACDRIVGSLINVARPI